MEPVNNNIGTWTAKVHPQEKKFLIKVYGEFPYAGDERTFTLTRNVTQGMNRKDLILALNPNKPPSPNGQHTAVVEYSEELIRKDQFETVTVPGPRFENIAFIPVEQPTEVK